MSLLDVSAATVSLAGIPIPKWMDGHDMLSDNFKREIIIAARDRLGSTQDRVRCVRTSRFKYIRNFHPERPYSQHSGYKRLQYPGQTVAEVLHRRNELSPATAHFWSERRPAEELYDLSADPEELRNLATSERHQNELVSLRTILDAWLEESGDQGGVVEQNVAPTIRSSENWYRQRMRKRGLDPEVSPTDYLEWWEAQLLPTATK